MSVIFGIIIGALLALFGLFGSWSEYEGTSGDQTCAVDDDGVSRCGPSKIDGLYQLPDSGVVVSAIVNNGPLPPEYQAGYEITIDADGHVTIEDTDEGTPEPAVSTADIGVDGLQELLGDLETAGFFYLPVWSEFEDADVPVGGGVSDLTVTLEDGTWEVYGAPLEDPDDIGILDSSQTIVANAVGQ
jgi:hypothetical protein